jgi:hypothetical protein
MVRNAEPAQAHVTFHKRAADAGPERLRQVLGVLALKGRRPSGKFLDADDEERELCEDERARN